MVRSLPLISLICAVIYLCLPMPALRDSDIQRVYSVWKAEAAKDDVVVLRGLYTKTRAQADKLRPRASQLGFGALQKEAMGGDAAEDGKPIEWSSKDLEDTYDEDFAKEVFAAKVGSVSSVRDTDDHGGAFYLILGHRKRTMPPFSEAKKIIQKRYEEYRASNRWASWLPSHAGPTEADFLKWYDEGYDDLFE